MDSIAVTKSKKKNKLFPCFRAAASGNTAKTMRCKDAPDDQDYPFIEIEERNGMMFHNMRPLDGQDEDFGHRKKKGGAAALSRALKAVLFGTSLAKKIRKRRAKQKQSSTKENQRPQAPSSISNRSIIGSDLNYRNSSTCSSQTSALFSNSSFCSSSPSSSDISDLSFRLYPPTSNPFLRLINLRKICSGWFLLLVCLLSLMICGKAGAIVCTSVLILCVSRRKIGFRSPDDAAASAETMNSGEYKKRIVMEGFLRRGRSASQSQTSSIF